jgi:hypothetical protein
MTLREGDREYYYAKLDHHFPGMKQRYIKAFGSNYECRSPNDARLTELFESSCREHGILYKTDEVFAYLGEFE